MNGNAISEYLGPDVKAIAKVHSLHINSARQRMGLGKKASTEILLTNYVPHGRLF